MNSKQAEIKIYTDGASRGNPGLSGAGVLILLPSPSLSPTPAHTSSHSLSVFLGKKTNNEAEYLALYLATRHLLQLAGSKLETHNLKGFRLMFFLDSKLVVEQMSGNWKIKNDRIKKLADLCHHELNQLGLEARFSHVARESNQQADWLANQAIDLSQAI